MVNNKKAQLKIQQMAVMLVVVTIFFAMVGMLILGVSLGGLRESADNVKEQNAMTLAMKIANSPEFSCGESFGNLRINCIDLDKAMIVKNQINKYSINPRMNFWGINTNIEIRRIYPQQENKECTMENYPNCSFIKMFDEVGFGRYNFILLCRKVSHDNGFYDKCEIGLIQVSYEKWNQ